MMTVRIKSWKVGQIMRDMSRYADKYCIDIEFGGGTKETLACANATLNYIKKEVEQLRSDG